MLCRSVVLAVVMVAASAAPARSGVFESAKKSVKSAVNGAGTTTRGAVDSTKAAVHSAVPSGWTEKKWKEERKKAKEERKGLQRYEGARVEIRAKGTKLAAMPMKFTGVEPKVAFISDDLLLTELFNAGFDAIGPEDINDMLGFETTKEQLGSDDSTQLSQIGGSLGVRYITAGAVSDVDGALAVNLKIIDVETKTVVARATRIADDGQKALPRTVAEVVQDLVRQSGM